MQQHPAIILAEGYFCTPNGKTAHGLVRGSDRFEILAVIDSTCAGQDAGVTLDGQHRNIPILTSVEQSFTQLAVRPEYALVGCATHGGYLTDEIRTLLMTCAQNGLHLVNGLHECISDDQRITALAKQQGLHIIDLRKPKSRAELHFWEGTIATVKAPRIAVLGTDCALGKRTTARLLTRALNAAGIQAEMIYTGQTGWMQGGRYGFVLDATPNDFVSGELEHAIVSCEREQQPEVMIIEGQSALRNPSGPCGSELLLSGGAKGVVLQHAPGRMFFEGYESLGYGLPSVADEIALIKCYGASTLAVTLQESLSDPALVDTTQQVLQQQIGIPVLRPLRQDLAALVPVVQRFIAQQGVENA